VSLDVLARTLEGRVRGRLAQNVPLAPLTTPRVGGAAALYLEPADARDLELLGEAITRAGLSDVPLLALGRGSNVVVSDEGWPGVVVRLGADFSWIRPSDGPEGLAAGGATPLPRLANWAARRGLAGLEFLVSVPGSVGGAVRMNAGAHGGAVADTLSAATVFSLEDLTVRSAAAAELELGYRRSSLGEQDLVLDAHFTLVPDDRSAVKERMASFRRRRAETQPPAVQNAGSTFENPPGDSAGRLVEAAGLKGFRVGGARISELHANFFMTERGATAQDVYSLVGEVRRRVAERFDVELVPEVRFMGRFEETKERRVG
jgi:UDP-N-acetylmuramate dehydrogenase